MHGGFHAVPGRLEGAQGSAGASGASRSLQGPPGASRGLQGPSGGPGTLRGLQNPKKPNTNTILNEKCARRVPPKPRTLGEAEISCRMVGLD